jgi:hypothetical protein
MKKSQPKSMSAALRPNLAAAPKHLPPIEIYLDPRILGYPVS